MNLLSAAEIWCPYLLLRESAIYETLETVRNREVSVLRGSTVFFFFLFFLVYFIHLVCLFIFLNPFAPGDFAEKRVLKLVEWFSGHCHAMKS